jgi:adenylate kinase family enzyme
MFINDLEKH